MRIVIAFFFLLGFGLSLSAQNEAGDLEVRPKDQLTEGPGTDINDFSTVDQPHLSGEEIQEAGMRNTYEMAMLMSSQVEYRGGDDLYYRNASSQIYVDGVKIRGKIGLPQKAIKKIEMVNSSR